MSTVFIASITPVDDVYMDVVLTGKANVGKLAVAPGTRKMVFVTDGRKVEKTITIQTGKNPLILVRFDERPFQLPHNCHGVQVVAVAWMPPPRLRLLKARSEEGKGF